MPLLLEYSAIANSKSETLDMLLENIVPCSFFRNKTTSGGISNIHTHTHTHIFLNILHNVIYIMTRYKIL